LRSRVKICGITNDADAQVAIEAGAEYLGIIFAKSARTISKDQAAKVQARLKNARTVKLVGVFRDNSAEEIAEAIAAYSLDYVQCHGSESREFCWALHFPLIKAIELRTNEESAKEDLLRQIDEYGPVSRYLLFDRPKGLAYDDGWLDKAIALLEGVHVPVPYFFAGGLNPVNVRTVLAALTPFAVDVASGIEKQVGQKDHTQLRQFVRAVQGYGGITGNRQV
jgi:phosphoribosylanthranilate isomerase